MQRSLTILSSVAAPLTLFITSKLVIPNIHERSCFRLQVARNISQRISQRSVAHATRALCSHLTLGQRFGSRNRWQKDLILINAIEKKEGKHDSPVRFLSARVAYQFYARCSGFRDFHETLSPSFFLSPLFFSFRSGPGVFFFFCNFQWWNIVENMSRWIYSLSKQRADAIMPRCPFLMIATFFLRFAEKHEIRTRSLRSTRLVSRNKSGGHATVRLWWLILFWRFAEKQNSRYIVSIYRTRVTR